MLERMINEECKKECLQNARKNDYDRMSERLFTEEC